MNLSDDEYKDHVSRLRSAINAAPSSAYSHIAHAGTVGGYSPERHAAHEAILDDAWAELGGDDIPRGRQGLILGGTPGSGKTSVRESATVPGVGPVKGGFLPIDSDYFKGKLIDAGLAPSLRGFSPMEAAPLMHKESNDIAKKFAQRAYDQGTNLAWDYTLRHSTSGPNRLKEFGRYDYTPHGIYVHASPQEALSRVSSRHRDDLGQYMEGLHRHGGRYVPPEIITDSVHGTRIAHRDNYDAIAPRLASSQVFNTSASKQASRRIRAAYDDLPPLPEGFNIPDDLGSENNTSSAEPWTDSGEFIKYLTDHHGQAPDSISQDNIHGMSPYALHNWYKDIEKNRGKTPEQLRGEREQSKAKGKEIAESLWGAMFPPEEEEGRKAVQNMDTVNSLMSNGWQPEHIKYDEDDEPYAHYQHPSGWNITDYGGMYKEIGHAATPGESHDVINTSRNIDGQDYREPFGPADAHAHIENQLHGDPEETGGTFQYLTQEDPRIKRYKPRLAHRTWNRYLGWVNRLAGGLTYDDDETSTPGPGKWRFENGVTGERFHLYGPSQGEAWKKYVGQVGCDCHDNPEDHEYGEDEENPLENSYVEKWDDPKQQYTHLKQLTDPQLFREWSHGYNPEEDPFDPRQFGASRLAMPQGGWYHASPHELAEGTHLRPGGNQSPFSSSSYHDQISDRSAQGVWVSPSIDDAHQWRTVMEEDGSPPTHVYQVQPHSDPHDHGYDEGHSTNGATVLRKVFDAHDGDLFKHASRTAGLSDQPDDVTGDYSLAEFFQWCAHNHKDADTDSLAQYAAVSGMDTEDYLDIYLFLSDDDGMFRQAATGIRQLHNINTVANHLGMDKGSLRTSLMRNEFPSPTHIGGKKGMLWDSLEPWEKWRAKHQNLRQQILAPLPLPEGWADEFKTDKEPQKLHTAGDIAQSLGLSYSAVKHWFNNPVVTNKPPPPSHQAGSGSTTAHLWDRPDLVQKWYENYRSTVTKGKSPGIPGPVKQTAPAAKAQDSICPNCFTQHAGECL